MPASKKKAADLPEEFKSIGDAAAFWVTHDASDHWGLTREVHFSTTLSKESKVVVLEAGIAKVQFALDSGNSVPDTRHTSHPGSGVTKD